VPFHPLICRSPALANCVIKLIFRTAFDCVNGLSVYSGGP
jgi:hypothetical protein